MALSRLSIIAAVLVLTASVANAYTVVMRDGRRVEIPNAFTVTSSTLTYEVSQGFHVTIQLNTVDIPATERANGAAPGSLLMKANAPNVSVPQTQRANAQRSITNADLEKYRAARVNSEKEYEERRKELGLPSLEERRREAAEITERTVEHARSLRAQEEAYWRSRAEAARAEMTMRQAQFGSSPQRPDEMTFSYPIGGFPAFGPFDGIGFGVTHGFGRFGRFTSSPFDGFLATPITPFPRFPSFRGHGRRAVLNPRVRFNPRPGHRRPGHGGHGRRR
jgi:hypothetical protein